MNDGGIPVHAYHFSKFLVIDYPPVKETQLDP